MQDRYSGDVGDFGKFALLHALAPGRRPAIGWYRTSGARETTNDGRHLDYLARPDRFARLAPHVFTALRGFVADFQAGRRPRTVAALEQLAIVPAAYHSTLCPRPGKHRDAWFAELHQTVRGADLVFLDPDNGLEGESPSHKSVALHELTALRKKGRALVVYHHQTRRKGGAPAEFAHQHRRLRARGFTDIRAVRLRPYSSRFYFVLDADRALHRRLDAFLTTWGADAEGFPG